MSTLKNILNYLFYPRTGSEGTFKASFLTGSSPFGRVCALHTEKAHFQYRFSVKEVRRLLAFGDEFLLSEKNPDREKFQQLLSLEKEGRVVNNITLFTDILKHLYSEKQTFWKTDDEVTLAQALVVEDTQIELFLVGFDRPTFIAEVFPQFPGCNLDERYGSNMKFFIPITMFGPQEQQLGPLQMKEARFVSLAFIEHRSQIKGNPIETGEKAFKAWKSAPSLWYLYDDFYKFRVLSTFIPELAIKLGGVSNITGVNISDSMIDGHSSTLFHERLGDSKLN